MGRPIFEHFIVTNPFLRAPDDGIILHIGLPHTGRCFPLIQQLHTWIKRLVKNGRRDHMDCLGTRSFILWLKSGSKQCTTNPDNGPMVPTPY